MPQRRMDPPQFSPAGQRATEVDDASLPIASQGVDIAFLRPFAAGIERQRRCQRSLAAYAPVADGWGRMGDTTLTLLALDEDKLREVLTLAWCMAQPKPRRTRKKPLGLSRSRQWRCKARWLSVGS